MLAFPVYLDLFLLGKRPIEGWLTEWGLWTFVGNVALGAAVGWIAGAAFGRLAFRRSIGSVLLRVGSG